MSTGTRNDGLAGFAGLALKIPGGWEYYCDGKIEGLSCPSTTRVPRTWNKTGLKTTGWLVMSVRLRTSDPVKVKVYKLCPSCVERAMKRQMGMS